MPAIPTPFSQLDEKSYESQNFYERLGLSLDDQNLDELIKKAYRERALLYHPNQHIGEPDNTKATRIFQTLVEAYETLSDQDKRLIYNSSLKPKAKQEEVKKEKPPEKPAEKPKESKQDFSFFPKPRKYDSANDIKKKLWSDAQWTYAWYNDGNLILRALRYLEKISEERLPYYGYNILKETAVIGLVLDDVFTAADIIKMSPELQHLLLKIPTNYLSGLKKLLQKDSWNSFTELGKKLLFLEGIFYQVIEKRETEFTTQIEKQKRDITQEQISTIKQLSSAEEKFLSRPKISTYVTSYERLILSFHLKREAIDSIPEQWWNEFPGVIDLIAQKYDYHYFLELKPDRLQYLNHQYVRRLLNTLSINEVLQLSERILDSYSVFSHLISLDLFRNIIKTINPNRLDFLFTCYPLLLQIITNEISLEQINQMDDELFLKWWRDTPNSFRTYLYDHLSESKHHCDSFAKTISNCFNYLINQNRISEILVIKNYLDSLEINATELLYQELLFKNYFRTSDKRIDLVKAQEFKPNTHILSLNNFFWRLRKDLIDGVIQEILATEWIAESKEEKTVAPIAKTLPQNIEAILTPLRTAANLPQTDRQVTTLLSIAENAAKTTEHLQKLIALTKPVSKYIDDIRQERIQLERSIIKSRVKTAVDACTCLACFCYCPVQYLLTCFNCAPCSGKPDVVVSFYWDIHYPEEIGHGDGKYCHFFCAPLANIKEACDDIPQQKKYREETAPKIQAMW